MDPAVLPRSWYLPKLGPTAAMMLMGTLDAMDLCAETRAKTGSGKTVVELIGNESLVYVPVSQYTMAMRLMLAFQNEGEQVDILQLIRELPMLHLYAAGGSHTEH